VYVLEVNPRASRTIPYVSKTIGVPLAKVASLVMVGRKLKDMGLTEEVIPQHMSVKEAVFPFVRFPGIDVILSPEMKSTGEVMGIDTSHGLAFLKSQVAAGNTIPVAGNVFLSLRDPDKEAAIPLARKLLELGFDIYATVIKGRSNYLCYRRFENLRRRGPNSVEEMRILAKILVWLQDNQSGDRAQISLNGPGERYVWTHLSADDEGCSLENCIKRTGGTCPFYLVRQSAQNAHLLIVNHALLLADVATGNRVLPDYEYLIVDEAHHLEDATTNALSFNLTRSEIKRLGRELGDLKSGVLSLLNRSLKNILSSDKYEEVKKYIQESSDHLFQFEHHSDKFFEIINQFLLEQRSGREIGPYAQQERITKAVRTQPSWTESELAWENAQHPLQLLIEKLNKITQNFSGVLEKLSEEDEEIYSYIANIHRRYEIINNQINALVFEPEPDHVYWIEDLPNRSKQTLHAAPIQIGRLMERYLWYEKSSVILTSATLTTGGEFDYLRGRLNAEDADELSLGSPFDYENAALVYIVNDIPEPNDRMGHQRAVEQGLIHLCRATGGKTLVLFTSYDQLRRTSRAITRVLAKSDVIVYEQGEGASPHALLETFRTSQKAVLLGTRALWEGVDVAGEALSVLVIVKLPFDVPTEPIISARAETFDDPFYQFSLPEAILRFRQGFGRLIRTKSDRGVVAIFDRRIISKRYGHLFLESIPHCSSINGSLSDLPAAAVKWLNL